jgi:mRNA-degrading endonuclease RelE of RelBE toxin-antitoxin system
MKEEKYRISVSATFEKKYRKILRRDGGIRELFASALYLLEKDPTGSRSTKRLVGIESGDGAWRIRMGIYRMRYDVDRQSVVLHTIGLRKDIYKRK